MTPDESTALRRPFEPAQIGILPKPYNKDSTKGNCKECGGYHGLPAVHLDFVGHAGVTARLLNVDPQWSWEPVALDEQGLPAYDRAGGLWIRLTVCGVTRLGYGDGPDPKQRIGDAIRNAAMRFGVALDLWSKQELDNVDPNGGGDESRPLPSAALPESSDQVSGLAASGPAETLPEDSPAAVPTVEDVVASLRDRAIDATTKKKREGLQIIARLNAEAAKSRVMQAPTTRPNGTATTMSVLLDEAMRHLNTTSAEAVPA